MKSLTLTQAFAFYAAQLPNARWAVSDIANDALVFGCWVPYFTKMPDGVWRYEDRLSNWGNLPGRDLARGHLRIAAERNLPVRMVLAKPVNPEVDVRNTTQVRASFSIREDMIGTVGTVTEFDGDHFIIDFRRE